MCRQKAILHFRLRLIDISARLNLGVWGEGGIHAEYFGQAGLESHARF